MKYELNNFHHITFHSALIFISSEKSDCMVDNIHLEKYVESMLNIYFPLQSQVPI